MLRLQPSRGLAGRQHNDVHLRHRVLRRARKIGAPAQRQQVFLCPHQSAGDDAIAQALPEQLRPGAEVLGVDREQFAHRNHLHGRVIVENGR